MRLLYVIDSLAPGGAETSLVEMAPGLVASGVDLHVLPLGSRLELAPSLRDAGAVLHTRQTPVGRLGNVRAVMAVAREISPALVHTTLYESDIAGRIAARLLRLPVSTSVVGDSYGAARRLEVDQNRLRFARIVDRLTARHASLFHAVSGSIATSTAANLGVPAERIVVIPRGRDPQRYAFRPNGLRDNVRAALGIATTSPVVLAVGRLEPAKGLIDLIQALPSLCSRHPDLVTLVAGAEGRSAETLRREAARTGTNIRFLGHRSDVAALLSAADVLCFPSRREGSPGTLIEAMAVGCPIVASDIPPNREVLGEGADSVGQMVPVGNPEVLGKSLLRSLADASSTEKKALLGRSRFEDRFTIDIVVSRMHDFFARAAAAGFPVDSGLPQQDSP